MLEACNYTVCEKILDTKLHGVPQSRRRLYMVGIRKDRARIDDKFQFPADLPVVALPLHKVLPRRVPLALQRSELTGHAQRNYNAAERAAKKSGLNMDKDRRDCPTRHTTDAEVESVQTLPGHMSNRSV
jgi:site-specific DNA-cytosine methylase